jgi:hypothetical protein
MYFDWAYIAKGLALHESLEMLFDDYHLWILAMCDDSHEMLKKLNLPHVTLITMSEFEYPELVATKADRMWIEYIWTCTPGFILRILRELGWQEPVTYIDADCYFFNSPQPVFDEIGERSVAITPHRFPEKYGHFRDSGLYNVGMVYVGPGGASCIEEWEHLCLNWCYLRHEPEHPNWYCDQKYWDELVPKYGAHPIQHPGANLAPWNAEGSSYSVLDNQLIVDGRPLIWYHFHGLKMSNSQIGRLWPPSYDIPDIVVQYAYKPYTEALLRNWRRVVEAS